MPSVMAETIIVAVLAGGLVPIFTVDVEYETKGVEPPMLSAYDTDPIMYEDYIFDEEFR